jgi:hypothetical protein
MGGNLMGSKSGHGADASIGRLCREAKAGVQESLRRTAARSRSRSFVPPALYSLALLVNAELALAA